MSKLLKELLQFNSTHTHTHTQRAWLSGYSVSTIASYVPSRPPPGHGTHRAGKGYHPGECRPGQLEGAALCHGHSLIFGARQTHLTPPSDIHLLCDLRGASVPSSVKQG